MRKTRQKRSTSMIFLTSLAGVLVLIVGLAALMAVRPAQASPLAQQNPTETPTVTVTVTPTVTNTATVTLTPTTTLVGTLPVQRTGTPTALVPRTGADLNQPGDGGSTGMWIAIWLLGLLLLGYGLKSRLNKPLQ